MVTTGPTTRSVTAKPEEGAASSSGGGAAGSKRPREEGPCRSSKARPARRRSARSPTLSTGGAAPVGASHNVATSGPADTDMVAVIREARGVVAVRWMAK